MTALRAAALAWAVLVLGAALGLGIAQGRGALRFETDIMALLPREEQDPALEAAKDQVARDLGRRVVLMVGSPDRARARGAALSLRDDLVTRGLVTAHSDTPDMERLKRLGAAYFPHRGALLSAADRASLDQDQGAQLARRALAGIYGFAGMADSTLLSRDPFLLFPKFLADLPVPARNLAMDEGLPSVTEAGTTWVMLSLVLAGEPYSLAIQEQLAAVLDAMPADIGLLRLGAVFFARDGAASAMEESSRIGLISLGGTILLVLAVFRSARPLLLSVLALSAGLVTALGACFALFGSIHVAAQLFGASLIGIAVDYALLYFGQVFTQRTHPMARMAKIRSGMMLGGATTILGYGALALAPFPGLKQVAVFSAAGLLGSLVSVLVWFPLLDNSPPRSLGPRTRRAVQALAGLWMHRGRRLAMVAILTGLAAWGAIRFQVDDDIRRQQTLSPALVAQQAEIQRLAGLGAWGRYILVDGDDEQQVLEREEDLAARLAGLAGVTSAARFVPSARRQADNARLVQDRLLAPHLAAHLAGLGLERIELAQPHPPLTLDSIRATGALGILDSLVLAPNRHVVLLDGTGDIAVAIAHAPGVHLVDPAADMSGLLARYRQRAVGLAAASVVLMAPLLVWRYGARRAVAVLAVPVLAVVLAPLLLAGLGMGFSFFGAMALVLVLSMGSDYALFLAEDKDGDPVTGFSVALAVATTLLSFGLLALSQVAAVRAFGATMLVGVALAYLLSPLAACHPWYRSGK